MKKWIRKRQRIESKEFFLSFYQEAHPDCGWNFPCEEDGSLLPLGRKALSNYVKCILDMHSDMEGAYSRTINEGVVERHITYTEPAILECPVCKSHVYLYSSEDCCVCGQWFNCFGQRLKPPSEWCEDY